MANSGILTGITLIQYDPDSGMYGSIKPNDVGDPDYIPPAINLDLCPITYNTECPIVVYTGGVGNILFEFTLPNSVVNNPSLEKVKINASIGMSIIGSITFTLPNSTPNYFSGSITGLSTGTYTLSIDYLNISDSIVASCSSLGTVAVS